MLRTFDLFDTLIARRCVSPIAVYQTVEHASQITGLVDARSRAGHQLWTRQTPHSTQDIYQLAISFLPPMHLKAEALAQLEYQSEYRECIPILRSLELIDQESVIVSDMHHPQWVLERLYLIAAQSMSRRWLPSMFVTNQNKHTGTFWQQLASQGHVATHLGDNPHSDVNQAQLLGHQATLFDWAQMQPTELRLAACGLHSLARATRSVRLRCVPSNQHAQVALIEKMCTHVIPILALASLLLRDLMRQHRKTTAVFVGRDGAVWQCIFNAMFSEVPTYRLPLSRRLMQDSPATAAAMVRSRVSPDALVVDLVGSGTSWSRLIAETGLEITPALCHLIRYPALALDTSLQMLSLIDLSQSESWEIYALEIFCEEVYPSACDAQWVDLEKHGGFAQIKHAAAESLTTSATSLPVALQACVQCASHELAFELARSKDICQLEAIHALLRDLVTQLGQDFAAINEATNFWNRNTQLAHGGLS
jgi:hypothetical protein